MAHISEMIAEDIHKYLESHENKGLLRFITCGSVDDGKSTLIGRLLYESKMLFDDHLEALKIDSKKSGTQGENLDFALLVDGLAAEREQGITIDVAYRFFSTDKRKFIVADTPGHEQYTRNMATGASTADLAILLIDARHGILPQTRRHSFIVSMLGVKKIILAVNKMDAIEYSQDIFESIVDEFRQFCEDSLEVKDFTAIPISALKGDNITNSSPNTNWYQGPPLMEYLETVEISENRDATPFRMPVQYVNRPDSNFRGFSGLIVGGKIQTGDRIRVSPSGKEAKVERIVTYDGDLDLAEELMSVTLTLDTEIDISRGDVISIADEPCGVANQFQSKILWMSEEPMMPGRQYLMKIGCYDAILTPSRPKHKIDVNSLELLPTKTLEVNEIGVCNINLDKPIPFDSYDSNRAMGGFIIIDRITNHTVGMGLINFELRRSSNIHWQSMDVVKEGRSEMKSQKPFIIWLTGLSGSGKSTIANLLEVKLFSLNKHTMVLDGDNVRHGLNKDLGFTSIERVENLRRIAEVSKLMINAGLISITSFISPFESERIMARSLVESDEFVEIHVHAPIEVAESRDAKGLYKKARAGELKNFTGIDSPYEEPSNPEIRIDTSVLTAEQAVDIIIEWLNDNEMI
jgi:bifunctional enzyme CysN/CysC